MPLKGAGDGSNKAQKAVVGKKPKKEAVRPSGDVPTQSVHPAWNVLLSFALLLLCIHACVLVRSVEQQELDEDDLAFKKKQAEEKKAAQAYLDGKAKKK